ncbi:MAG: acetyl-CoA hydrolase/transferase C-terminal domain-containing protein, partial [Panacagrimonas sp.]
ILAALSDHRDLRVWSGMASTPVLALLDRGVIAGRASLTLGVALGDRALYERAGLDEAFYFRPVSETHDVPRMAAIRRFVAINSAVEVDLFGQVNADAVNGRLAAGVGGLPAFAAGAALSEGGRSIIALPAATDDGRFSRIVPRLSAPGVCAIPRHFADAVVTEHGVAQLRGLDLHGRARALISIAAPAMRETLSAAWAELARAL